MDKNNQYNSVFISDVHLGFLGCKAEKLYEFLNKLNCKKLFLVGDIIDFWAMKDNFYWPKEHQKVLDKLKEFKPEFLLFSAGFDAHIDDPLAQLRLSSEDFYKITKRTLEVSKPFCNGNIVSILEGGYDLRALQESTQRHVDALIEFN